MKKFVTAINCIDGRAHVPVIDWLKAATGADFVDQITEPGADKVLAGGAADLHDAIREKLLISITAHDSKTVAVVGHHDCAANPVSEVQHKKDIAQAVANAQAWGLPVQVIGLWLNAEWQVEVVSAPEPE